MLMSPPFFGSSMDHNSTSSALGDGRNNSKTASSPPGTTVAPRQRPIEQTVSQRYHQFQRTSTAPPRPTINLRRKFLGGAKPNVTLTTNTTGGISSAAASGGHKVASESSTVTASSALPSLSVPTLGEASISSSSPSPQASSTRKVFSSSSSSICSTSSRESGTKTPPPLFPRPLSTSALLRSPPATPPRPHSAYQYPSTPPPRSPSTPEILRSPSSPSVAELRKKFSFTGRANSTSCIGKGGGLQQQRGGIRRTFSYGNGVAQQQQQQQQGTGTSLKRGSGTSAHKGTISMSSGASEGDKASDGPAATAATPSVPPTPPSAASPGDTAEETTAKVATENARAKKQNEGGGEAAAGVTKATKSKKKSSRRHRSSSVPKTTPSDEKRVAEIAAAMKKRKASSKSRRSSTSESSATSSPKASSKGRSSAPSTPVGGSSSSGHRRRGSGGSILTTASIDSRRRGSLTGEEPEEEDEHELWQKPTMDSKSIRTLKVDDDEGGELEETKVRDRVAVFNANTVEGGSIVRSLAKADCDVVAMVRVMTSRNARAMMGLPGVVVKVADSLHDTETLSQAIVGCDRVFMVTKYWEKFDNYLEERQACTVFEACNKANVHHVVFSTFEDTRQLRARGEKSQIVPKADGSINPKFEGMKKAKKYAKSLGVRVTHMITSFLDQKNSRKSLCLIKGQGKLIIQPHLEE